jgi:hypothetical protein
LWQKGRFERIRRVVRTVYPKIDDKKGSEARLHVKCPSLNGQPISFSLAWTPWRGRVAPRSIEEKYAQVKYFILLFLRCHIKTIKNLHSLMISSIL